MTIIHLVSYIESFYVIREICIERYFDQNSGSLFFLGIIGTLGFESSKIVISFNNNGNYFLFSPVDVGLRLNHINCYVLCVFCFHFLILLSLLLFFVMVFPNRSIYIYHETCKVGRVYFILVIRSKAYSIVFFPSEYGKGFLMLKKCIDSIE